MKQHPNHGDQIVALKRIEGQVKGLQKMIDERRYCVDILTQIASVVGALLRVQDKVLEKHLQTCVTDVLKSRSSVEKQKMIDEMLGLIRKFRKTA